MKPNKVALLDKKESKKTNRKLENFEENKDLDSKEIMFIHEGRILRINLETLSKSESPLYIQERISPFISMCRLPNSEVFCYGNGSGFTFTFNSQGSFRQLWYGRPYYDSGCVYYNGNVYAFGGSSGYRVVNRAYKFSLSKNQWSRLANMPAEFMLCSCAVLQHKIIISCSDGSRVYDPEIDSYTELSPSSQINGLVVYVIRNRGYIFGSGGKIYESGVRNPYNWELSGNVTPLKNTPFGYFGHYKDAFYFLLRDFCLYKFDIQNRHFSKVASFSE
ncbi:unnamed protein product [Blepharisma stoltei]|uniref:Uncharacterized protein n=1 Tax=Blepharisma stoltei TaxID=1481888 RepID=A0AAU9JI96_9CILI|nr:unnamed protein product [Blepharisma stoltei]